MHFSNPAVQTHFPDGKTDLARTTDLCIAAHQDDIEIMAFAPIIACYGKADKHFTGVCVTDGGGAPRSGIYADYSDDDMKVIRAIEQNQAADVGKYAAQVQLAWPSSGVKAADSPDLVRELRDIILACKAETLYTHNLADKHDTHVAVTLQVIRALRSIPVEQRPKRVISMEVWRSLDWLNDEDKVAQNTGEHPNVAATLLGVYDSQIAGGKRYDLASIGRRLANATFFASHDVDDTDSMSYGLDITDLVNSDAEPAAYIQAYIDKFAQDVRERIGKLS